MLHQNHASLSVACLLCFISANLPQAVGKEKTKPFTARTLKLEVPSDWESVKTSSQMRAAQFKITSEGKEESADLVVFYFGGPTGGITANVNRWISQFAEDDRKLTMTQGKCKAGSCIVVDAIGTWNKPDGPPFAQKTVKTPDSRVVNVIIIEQQDDKEDYYFLKLSGPKNIVSPEANDLLIAIGADPKSMRPFELKDAKN